MENRDLAITNSDQKWNARQIDVFKKTVAVGASNEELRDCTMNCVRDKCTGGSHYER